MLDKCAKKLTAESKDQIEPGTQGGKHQTTNSFDEQMAPSHEPSAVPTLCDHTRSEANELHNEHNVRETSAREQEHTRTANVSLEVALKTVGPSTGIQDESDKSTAGMLLPVCMKDDTLLNILYTASKEPPVTTGTLGELDLPSIQRNINLRIDVNYDDDLHFQPVSGEKGEEKRIEAKRYWLSLATEFRIYQHNSAQQCDVCRDTAAVNSSFFVQRLPIMFAELRSLLITLVPDDDRDEIENHMDVELLMQQVSRGVLDVVRLSEWLAELLTNHCAPIRDELAEDMSRKITEGARHGDMESLVQGLEKLFSFLEAMKLDVSNHQIRTFRYQLIDDTVSFQQDYFKARLENGKLDVSDSRDWYHSMNSQMALSTKGAPACIKTLIYGLVQLCTIFPPTLPDTLKHDFKRVQQLHNDLQDIVHLQISLDTFNSRILDILGPEINPRAMYQKLRIRIMDLTDADNESNDSIYDIWHNHVESISLEITRAAFAISHHCGGAIPDDAFRFTQSELQRKFDDEQATHCRAQEIAHQLERMTMSHVSTFQNMSTISIAEAQKHYQQARQNNGQPRTIPDLEDVSRRLVHMAVIHWRVWSEMVYL